MWWVHGGRRSKKKEERRFREVAVEPQDRSGLDFAVLEDVAGADDSGVPNRFESGLGFK